MKKIFLLLGTILFNVTALFADVTLPVRCEVCLPALLYKNSVLKESDANKIASSSDYGQSKKPYKDHKYWVVYSDRQNNTTYVEPQKGTAEYTKLDFNEKLRIASIKNGFALVYKEPKEGASIFPAISSEAKSMGWVPMDKLLLWTTCPANDKGIYHKALLVVNVDKAAQKKSQDIGRMYKNPENRDSYEEITTGMSFYFIMKREANGLVLLAREYSLGGVSDQVLYGWVDETSFVSWNQRSCIEPTWNDESIAKIQQQGGAAKVFADKQLATYVTHYPIGKEYGGDFRLPPTVLRYPILDNDTGRDDLYKCTVFGTVDGDLGKKIDDASKAREEQERALKQMQKLNLIIVIDGTRSMEPYFPAVKDAIRQGCGYFDKNKYTPRVGLVIYRDYADGEKGLVEYVPMADPNDPMLNEYLDKGGQYGIRSSSADKTYQEALFKGLETALDTERMGYSKDESNLMLVIGDCGNKEDDTQCLTKEQLIEKMVENKINLMTFQVRRNNDEAWNSFTRQLNVIMKDNIQTQYTNCKLNVNVRFNRTTDGIELKPAFDVARQFFIGSTRFAEPGVDMDPEQLSKMMQKNLGDFGVAVQERINALATGGFSKSNISDSQKTDGAKMDAAFMRSVLGDETYELLKESESLIAFSGYTQKKAPDGSEYWRPVLFISRDEFTQLLERLGEVDSKAKTDDRKPYVDAMMSLVRGMLPDITNEEMENMEVDDIMDLIAGLNERPESMEKGPSLRDIQNQHAVTPGRFKALVTDFQKKYRNLRRIKEDPNYKYIYKFNNIEYYWIPIEELP